MNGLVRQYFPKGFNFTEITNEQIKFVEEKLDNRPRKRFGFLSPNQVYSQAIKNNGKLHLLLESANLNKTIGLQCYSNWYYR